MGLRLPGNIPVAAASLGALLRRGRCEGLPKYRLSTALVQFTDDASDPVIVWASPNLRGYRAVWSAAHDLKAVDEIDTWGKGVDVDHVYPKSWATVAGMEMAYVRLFPAWGEVNRSAGAGREKSQLHELQLKPKRVGEIIYATELQVLKILGHPVGTASKPVSIFSRRG
jgi:hypothetical protein